MVLDAIEQAIWTRYQEGVSIGFGERLADAGLQPLVREAERRPT